MFTLSQPVKAQRWSRSVDLHFLEHWR